MHFDNLVKRYLQYLGSTVGTHLYILQVIFTVNINSSIVGTVCDLLALPL